MDIIARHFAEVEQIPGSVHFLDWLNTGRRYSTMDHYQNIDLEHQKLILIKKAKQLHEEVKNNPLLRDYVISYDDKDLEYKSEDK